MGLHVADSKPEDAAADFDSRFTSSGRDAWNHALTMRLGLLHALQAPPIPVCPHLP